MKKRTISSPENMVKMEPNIPAHYVTKTSAIKFQPIWM